MAIRTAVVLVAGVGSRLRPLTDDRPKALVDLGGETILARTLRLLRNHGVQKVVLASGYREQAVRAAVIDSGLEVIFCPNPRFDSTQNSVSLWLCREAVAGEAFFKLDGDVVFEAPVLERLEASGASLSVAVDQKRVLDEEAMKLTALPDGTITRFGKSLPVASALGESIGIERLDAAAGLRVFEALSRASAEGRTQLYYEDVYDELIRAGQLKAQAVLVGDLPWTEVDSPEDLEQARQMVLRASVP